MAILLTGATGYLGSYIVAELLAHCRERLALLVRAESSAAARRRLWQALQLHMDFAHFQDALERCDLYVGDMTQKQLGLTATAWHRLVRSTTAVIHTAAAVNRLSLRRCMDVNLRGTLTMIQLARAAHAHHGLRRFSAVSTVSVAGFRHDTVVMEDERLPGNRYDNDPYGLSKQCCETLIHTLLADIPYTIFRPSAILGDSRFPQTTQFDNARAFVTFARAGVLPLRPEWRLDLVPADYVGQAIVSLHQKDRLDHPRQFRQAGHVAQHQAVFLRLHESAIEHHMDMSDGACDQSLGTEGVVTALEMLGPEVSERDVPQMRRQMLPNHPRVAVERNRPHRWTLILHEPGIEPRPQRQSVGCDERALPHSV
jgi:thioester reductase-like protein